MSMGFQMAVGGFLFVLTLTLQDGLGYDPFETGLVHLPFAAGVSFSIATLGRRVLPNPGPKMITAGVLLMLAGFAALLVLFQEPGHLTHHPLPLALPLLIAGLGMGSIAGPLQPIALSEIEVHQVGAAECRRSGGDGGFAAPAEVGAVGPHAMEISGVAKP